MSERINIKWTPGLPSGNKDAVRRQRGLKKVSGYDLIESELGWEVHELPPGLAKKEIEWLEKHPNVLKVEPEGFGTFIQPVSVDVISADAENGVAQSVESGNEWWQTFIKAPQAWTVSKGLGSIAAITDNGLGPNSFTDSHLVETKIFDAAETDAFGGSHGNPVTGLVVGTALECGVTNYKISGSDMRCSWNDVSNAWLWAKQQGRKVINTSWGGGSSLVLQDSAKACKDAGIAIVCAAGNSSGDTQFPASLPTCYAVSAVYSSGDITSFSCRGKIDIAAPGANLLTTISGGGWATFSGTSGAAPIITGCLLLIIARNPSWTGVQAMEQLIATATPKLPTTYYGAGLPNVARAIGADDSIPDPLPDPPPQPEPNMTNLNPLAKWTSLQPYTSNGLANILDDQTGTMSLWKSSSAWLRADFSGSGAVTCGQIQLTCTNAALAYPDRDPARLQVSVDGGAAIDIPVPSFTKSYEKKMVTFSAMTGTQWEIVVFNGAGNYLEFSGLMMLGDVSQGPVAEPSQEVVLAVSDMDTLASSLTSPADKTYLRDNLLRIGNSIV